MTLSSASFSSFHSLGVNIQFFIKSSTFLPSHLVFSWLLENGVFRGNRTHTITRATVASYPPVTRRRGKGMLHKRKYSRQDIEDTIKECLLLLLLLLPHLLMSTRVSIEMPLFIPAPLHLLRDTLSSFLCAGLLLSRVTN